MEEDRQLFYYPGPNRFAFFAGVIMPAISITVEATTHICAEVFFDPLPTSWHLLLSSSCRLLSSRSGLLCAGARPIGSPSPAF